MSNEESECSLLKLKRSSEAAWIEAAGYRRIEKEKLGHLLDA